MGFECDVVLISVGRKPNTKGLNLDVLDIDLDQNKIKNIKSDLYFVLDQLNVPIDNLVHEDINSNYFHPGKSAKLRIGKNIIAQFGEIHPYILQKFEIKTKVNGFEIYLDELSNFQTKKTSTKKAYENNVLQAVERDFAFLLPKKIKAEEVIKLIKSTNKQLHIYACYIVYKSAHLIYFKLSLLC